MMKKKNKLDHVSVAAAPVSNWEMFVRAVAAHVDPVLASMLFATEFVSFDQTQKIVRVATLKKFVSVAPGQRLVTLTPVPRNS